MVRRYCELRSALQKLAVDEVDRILPSPTEERGIDNILSLLEKFESIQLELQRGDITMS